MSRLDEALSSITWVMAKDPERFKFVGESGRLRMASTGPFADMPALRVFFWHDEQAVHLLWIESAEDIEED